ncbi:MAG TPA: hypothetical protein H9853_11810 [Candidatus Sphingobacterium stercoripullorum]|uniref:YbbR-like protein n=1 Tax=Candidatus Sphingobacterium stercoripullorum TaxID=2838759 RepID=A0A9D1WCA9_9SPHI|nr:hypothetical protein [Candidatus Sphingobacterium stercoripullorum]
MVHSRHIKVRRRRLVIFFRCLVISFVAWALFAVSNNYTVNFKVGLEYVNAPEDKAFHPLQSDTVQVTLEMSGWKLLAMRVKSDSGKMRVDLSPLEEKNNVIFSNQLNFINRQYPSDRKVLRVSPDTLYFDFSQQSQRRVPIKPLYNLNFRKQYGITGKVWTNPDYVTIAGPMEDVANIEYIETDTIRASDVYADLRTRAALNKKNKTHISIYPTSIEIAIPVGELTEKIIEVPIKVEGASKYTSVRVLPPKVQVKVLVALKDYNSISSSDFEAVVDLARWEEERLKNLPVILTKKPEFCELVSIDPQNVDFFVRR